MVYRIPRYGGISGSDIPLFIQLSQVGLDFGRYALCAQPNRHGPDEQRGVNALSANIVETPATFGITVGRWR